LWFVLDFLRHGSGSKNGCIVKFDDLVKRRLALRGRNQLRDNQIEGASKTLLVGLQDSVFLEAFFHVLEPVWVD
jgi:hypothetical protein